MDINIEGLNVVTKLFTKNPLEFFTLHFSALTI